MPYTSPQRPSLLAFYRLPFPREAPVMNQERLTVLEADMGLFISIPGIIVLYSFPHSQNKYFKEKKHKGAKCLTMPAEGQSSHFL
jgi:hypothetical protein